MISAVCREGSLVPIDPPAGLLVEGMMYQIGERTGEVDPSPEEIERILVEMNDPANQLSQEDDVLLQTIVRDIRREDRDLAAQREAP